MLLLSALTEGGVRGNVINQLFRAGRCDMQRDSIRKKLSTKPLSSHTGHND